PSIQIRDISDFISLINNPNIQNMFAEEVQTISSQANMDVADYWKLFGSKAFLYNKLLDHPSIYIDNDLKQTIRKRLLELSLYEMKNKYRTITPSSIREEGLGNIIYEDATYYNLNSLSRWFVNAVESVLNPITRGLFGSTRTPEYIKEKTMLTNPNNMILQFWNEFYTKHAGTSFWNKLGHNVASIFENVLLDPTTWGLAVLSIFTGGVPTALQSAHKVLSLGKYGKSVATAFGKLVPFTASIPLKPLFKEGLKDIIGVAGEKAVEKISQRFATGAIAGGVFYVFDSIANITGKGIQTLIDVGDLSQVPLTMHSSMKDYMLIGGIFEGMFGVGEVIFNTFKNIHPTPALPIPAEIHPEKFITKETKAFFEGVEDSFTNIKKSLLSISENSKLSDTIRETAKNIYDNIKDKAVEDFVFGHTSNKILSKLIEFQQAPYKTDFENFVHQVNGFKLSQLLDYLQKVKGIKISEQYEKAVIPLGYGARQALPAMPKALPAPIAIPLPSELEQFTSKAMQEVKATSGFVKNTFIPKPVIDIQVEAKNKGIIETYLGSEQNAI
ncbi:MAG: hypothetical protein ACK4NF_07355, partial [Planctomycetota bacterium]